MNSLSSIRRLRRVATAVLIAAVAACGPLRRGGGRPPLTVIYFTNESLYQANVYLTVPGATSRRIGTVMGGQTDTLMVPADLAGRGGTVNVVARLLGRSSPQTGPVSILPGGEYEVRLPFDGRLLSFLPVGR